MFTLFRDKNLCDQQLTLNLDYKLPIASAHSVLSSNRVYKKNIINKLFSTELQRDKTQYSNGIQNFKYAFNNHLRAN